MKSVSISFVLEWFILPFQATAFVLLHNMKRPLGGNPVIVDTYLLLRYLNVGNVKVVTVLCLQSLMITRTIIAVIADQKR